MVATVTLPIPDEIYHRLELNAQATGRYELALRLNANDRRYFGLCASGRQSTKGRGCA